MSSKFPQINFFLNVLLLPKFPHPNIKEHMGNKFPHIVPQEIRDKKNSMFNNTTNENKDANALLSKKVLLVTSGQKRSTYV